MHRQRRDRAAAGRGDREMGTGSDVARGKNVTHRGPILVVDDDESLVIPLASQLHAEVVGGVVADREEDAIALDHASVIEH